MAYSDDIVALSPRVYWPLTEASGNLAADASGNLNTLTHNATSVTPSSSPIPSFLVADDGLSCRRYVREALPGSLVVSNGLLPTGTDWSVLFWVKERAFINNGFNTMLQVDSTQATIRNPALRVHSFNSGGNTSISSLLRASDGGLIGTLAVPPVALAGEVNRLRFVVLTMKYSLGPNQMQGAIYLDGVEQSTSTVSGSKVFFGPSTIGFVGGSGFGTDFYPGVGGGTALPEDFTAQIDIAHVAILDHALTPAEVVELYSSGLIESRFWTGFIKSVET